MIKEQEDVGIKLWNNPSVFTEHSNTMDYVYNKTDDHNPLRKRKTLIVFHDMIADTMTNEKFQAIISRTMYFPFSLIFLFQKKLV